MGMPLREVESQTHYTGNDSISCAAECAHVGEILKDPLKTDSDAKLVSLSTVFNRFTCGLNTYELRLRRRSYDNFTSEDFCAEADSLTRFPDSDETFRMLPTCA